MIWVKAESMGRQERSYRSSSQNSPPRNPPKCKPGHYFSDIPPPGRVSDRGWCHPCATGTYMDVENRGSQCKPCTTCFAAENMVTDRQCESTSDARCRCHDDYQMVDGRCRKRPNIEMPVTTVAVMEQRTVDPETLTAANGAAHHVISAAANTTNDVKLTYNTATTNIYVRQYNGKDSVTYFTWLSPKSEDEPATYSKAFSPSDDVQPGGRRLAEPSSESLMNLGLKDIGKSPMLLALVVTAGVSILALLFVTGIWVRRRRRKPRDAARDSGVSSVHSQETTLSPSSADRFAVEISGSSHDYESSHYYEIVDPIPDARPLVSPAASHDERQCEPPDSSQRLLSMDTEAATEAFAFDGYEMPIASVCHDHEHGRPCMLENGSFDALRTARAPTPPPPRVSAEVVHKSVVASSTSRQGEYIYPKATSRLFLHSWSLNSS